MLRVNGIVGFTARCLTVRLRSQYPVKDSNLRSALCRRAALAAWPTGHGAPGETRTPTLGFVIRDDILFTTEARP